MAARKRGKNIKQIPFLTIKLKQLSDQVFLSCINGYINRIYHGVSKGFSKCAAICSWAVTT